MRATRSFLLVGWLLAAVLIGCGSDIGGGTADAPVCDGVTMPGCGDTCSGPSDCAAGTHCGPDGMCVAECTSGGGECGAGRICTTDGRCIADPFGDGGLPDAPGCASVSVSLTPTIPTVVLLIDRSSSMSSKIGNDDDTVRWTAVKDALIDPTDGVVKTLQGRVEFGAALYSAIRSNNPPPVSQDPCPRMLKTASIALDNYDAIDTLLTSNNPAGGTPTEAAVRNVTADFSPEPDGTARNVILLATDGDPDTCDIKDTSAAIKTGVEDAVEDAHALGIETYVLSVGNQVAATHLQRIANEGIGLDRETGEAEVFRADTAADLELAINRIIRGARDCRLALDGTLNLQRASEGVVTLNGVVQQFGTDWTVVDETTIQLEDAACETFLNQDTVSVTAEFPCGVIVE